MLKRILLAVFIVTALLLTAIPQPVQAADIWWDDDWFYRRAITIDSTLIDAPLTDFPVMVELTEGVNYNFSHGQANGFDVRFVGTDDPVPTVYYHERERHAEPNATYWVRIPDISDTVDTVFYMYYGNLTAPDGTNQTNVWDDNYRMVLHLYDDAGGNVDDSTAVGQDGTKVAADEPLEVDYYVYKGQDSNLGGANIDRIVGTNIMSLSATAITIEAVVNFDVFTGAASDNPRIIDIHDGTYSVQIARSSISGKFSSKHTEWQAAAISTEYDAIPIVATTYHLQVILDATGNLDFMFVNGVLQGEAAGNNCTAAVIGNDYTLLNRSDIVAGAAVDGRIDEIRISNTARSAEWAKASYNSGQDTLLTYGAEAWANFRIQDVKICTGYSETDDWLVVVRYSNYYPPYYDTYDVQSHFVLQFVSDNATVRAQTSLPQWGNRPGSIYLSAETAAALEYGGAYRVRMYGLFAGNPYVEYTLEDIDWLGSDLTRLDSWVITSASAIGTHYGQVFTSYIADRGEVLNPEGGILFNNGISGLSIIRPNIFQTYSRPGTYTAGEFDQEGRISMLPWQEHVGEAGTTAFTRLGNVWGIDGGAMLAGIFLIITFGIAALGFRPGHTTAAMILSLIPLIGAVAFGVDMIIIGIITLIAAFLFFKRFWLDTGQ